MFYNEFNKIITLLNINKSLTFIKIITIKPKQTIEKAIEMASFTVIILNKIRQTVYDKITIAL